MSLNVFASLILATTYISVYFSKNSTTVLMPCPYAFPFTAHIILQSPDNFFICMKLCMSAFLLIDTLGFDVTESSHLQILLIPSFRTWCTSQQKLMGTHQLVHFFVLQLIYRRYLFSENQDCRPHHGI